MIQFFKYPPGHKTAPLVAKKFKPDLQGSQRDAVARFIKEANETLLQHKRAASKVE